MSITYTAFKKKYPTGSSVAKPFLPYDYRGECVSLFLTYARQVDGVPFSAPMGHAAQIPYNATFKKHYRKLKSGEKPKVGDLMFWANDAGNWTSEAGHVAIYDGGDWMWNQNYGGSRQVSRNQIFWPGFMGYWRARNKEEEMITSGMIGVLVRVRCGRAASVQEKKDYAGKETVPQFWKRIQSWGTAETAVKEAKAGKLDAERFLVSEIRNAIKK